jgi:hypothetical protein
MTSYGTFPVVEGQCWRAVPGTIGSNDPRSYVRVVGFKKGGRTVVCWEEHTSWSRPGGTVEIPASRFGIGLELVDPPAHEVSPPPPPPAVPFRTSVAS